MSDRHGPPYRPEREVRFAVVMYGGVSLAIYINGVAQELFRLVRATAPAGPGDDRAWHPTAAAGEDGPSPLRGSELAYRKLGQLLPGAAADAPDPAPEAPIRTRFVVDVLSGSSAGGINGIFLAKAIANQQTLDALRGLWVEEGDAGVLLNDRRRRGPLPSLLDGDRLYERALAALRGMEPTAERPADDLRPSYAEELDLAVTMTDLQGLRLPIRLSDRVVYERRHRAVLRFVYAHPRATGDHRNDFTAGDDDLLAFAARATSSFPFAFAPMLPDDATRVDGQADPARWSRFFSDYVRRGEPYERFAFADGGYLDNKPFTHATDRLRRRRADLPVDRKLIYVEPDPSDAFALDETVPPAPEGARERPDVVANVAAAASGLPRAEPIRDDIAAIVERNRTIVRVRELTREVERSLTEEAQPVQGPVRRAYVELRLQLVAEDMAEAIARVAGLGDAPEDVEAVALLVRAWLEDTQRDDPGAFLYRADLRYRLRRIAFVQDRINELLRAPETGPDDAERLRALKRELNDLFVELRRRGRTARAASPPGEEAQDESLRAFRTAVAALRLDRGRVLELLAAGEDTPRWALQDARRRAAALLERWALAPVLAVATSSLSEYLRPALRDADQRVPALLHGAGLAQPLADALALYDGRFEAFDMVVLPLTYPELEEANPVDVVRVSPPDAAELVRDEERRKLAGAAVHHFGGFLHGDWRRNDMLWGRLDGAERILACLLPAGPLRDRLRTEAQAAIVREELLDAPAGALTEQLIAGLQTKEAAERLMAHNVGLVALAGRDDASGRAAVLDALRRLPDRALLEHFRASWRIPDGPDAPASLQLLGRSMNVTGRVLDDVANRHSLPTAPLFWLLRAARLVWGVGELAMPRGRTHIPGLLFRYWAQLAMLLAALLIVVGILSGADGAELVGWLLAAAVAIARTVVWLAETTAALRRGALLAAAMLIGLAVVALAVLEAVQHDVWEDLRDVLPF